jgi:hypothetical protein
MSNRSNRDDVRGLVTTLYAQADIEMRNGNTETAFRIDRIAEGIRFDTAPLGKVFDIFVSVNEGRFDDAEAALAEIAEQNIEADSMLLTRDNLELDSLPSPDDDPPSY